MTIGGKLASVPDSCCEIFEDIDGRLPIDACIRDAHTLLESGWSLGWHLLVAFINIRLDHDTDDGGLAGAELFTNDFCNLWLIPVVLV